MPYFSSGWRLLRQNFYRFGAILVPKQTIGFSTGGATLEDLKLMKTVVGDKLGVKASDKNKTVAFNVLQVG
jgi:deoxyribose-phosphate aldolase